MQINKVISSENQFIIDNLQFIIFIVSLIWTQLLIHIFVFLC
jgi:hypothetical protein